MAQARIVTQGLEAAGHSTEIVGITTRGDRLRDRSIASIGGDGVFVKELMASLMDGRADVAVHSMKDLPTDLPDELCAGAILEREDARDVLVSRANAYPALAALPHGAVVGTSSLRRKALLAIARPDAASRDLRGNVDTRIRKVLDGGYDAAILALAGLKRIGLLASVGGGSPLSFEEMLPATGQGAIYAQCRGDDREARAALAPLNHPPTALATAMERAVLKRLGGGCLVPVGIHAQVDETAWRIDALIAAADGKAWVRRGAHGKRASDAEAILAAQSVADELLASGGRALVEQFRITVTNAKET